LPLNGARSVYPSPSIRTRRKGESSFLSQPARVTMLECSTDTGEAIEADNFTFLDKNNRVWAVTHRDIEGKRSTLKRIGVTCYFVFIYGATFTFMSQ
jgi:hypothetical protein